MSTARLRDPVPGDFDWVTRRHADIYRADYGFGPQFETQVAGIIADFIAGFDAARERCWIAELGGAPVGSVFLVQQSPEVAQLRLLLVDPAARGQGLGRRLVQECIGFARGCGYRRITLGTHSILLAARQIYRDAGFVLTARVAHDLSGPQLIAETWELAL